MFSLKFEFELSELQDLSHTSPMNLKAVLLARCPSCRKGPVTSRLLSVRKRCPECGYDFQPESGYYLGAMMISFFVSGFVTIPVMVILKVKDIDLFSLFLWSSIEFGALLLLLVFYSRIIWLHLEHSMTRRLDRRG